MPKYDFHNCLDSERFEHFSCAVISVRENKTFQRFSAGKDGGIDGFYCSDDGKIILQAKRIQTSRSKLLSEMRKEAWNAKYLNAERYILVLSMSISNVDLKDEICNLFQGAIKNTQDIVTCQDLNGYLEDPKYKQVELAYQELWLKSSNILSQLLYENVNKGALQKMEGHLRRIEEAVKTYVPTVFYYDALKVLQTKRYIMLTGEPGVGKTTTAYNLAHYFVVNKGYEQIFVVENIEEIYQLNDSNKKQVFVFDDFWGKIKFSRNHVDINWEKRLLNLLDDIKYFCNSLLIITTREFVLQQGICHYTEVGERCEHEKILIDMNEHTLIQKAKILFRHVYESNLDWDYAYNIYLCNKEIVEHPNFNPRIISYFCKNISTEGKTTWEYFAEIKRFISVPYKYWEDTLKNLSEGAKYICFALGMSEEEILLHELQVTFLGIVENGVEQVNREDFPSYMKELEDMFIHIYEYSDEEIENEIAVDFINHSLRDFIERYITKYIKVYENMFVKGLRFFNQLNYILYENPFGMSDAAVEIGVQRLAEDIDLLKFSYLFNRDVSRDYTVVHDTKAYREYKVWQLMLLYQKQRYQILTDFFSAYVNSVYENLRSEEIGYNYRALINIAEIIPRLYKCEIHVPVKSFIEAFYNNVSWVEQFYYMDICFYEIFGKTYQDFRTKHLKEIQTNILTLLPEDIEFFLDTDDDWELEIFVDHLPEIFKQFNMDYTEDLKNTVYEWAEFKRGTREVTNNDEIRAIVSKEEQVEINYNEFLETEIRPRLLGREEGLDEEEMEQLIEEFWLSVNLKTKLLEHKDTYIWKGDFIYEDFCNVLNYLDQINEIPDDIYHFYEGYAGYLQKDIDAKIDLVQIHELAKLLIENKSSVFTENSTYIQNWKHTVGIEFLYKLYEVGILRKNNKWICFMNDDLLVYYGLHSLFTAGHDEKLIFYKDQFMELLYENSKSRELILYFAQNIDRQLLNEFVILVQIDDFLAMNTELQEELKIKKFLQLIEMSIYRENRDFNGHSSTSYPALELLEEIEYSIVSAVWDDLTTFAKLMLDGMGESCSDKICDMEVDIYSLTNSSGWYDLMCKNDLHRNIIQLYFILKETQKNLGENGYNFDVFSFWKQL